MSSFHFLFVLARTKHIKTKASINAGLDGVSPFGHGKCPNLSPELLSTPSSAALSFVLAFVFAAIFFGFSCRMVLLAQITALIGTDPTSLRVRRPLSVRISRSLATHVGVSLPPRACFFFPWLGIHWRTGSHKSQNAQKQNNRRVSVGLHYDLP